MIVILLLTCFFFVLLHHYVIHFSRKGRLINRIPGPMQFPIIGNVAIAFRYSLEDIWSQQCKKTRLYYPIFKFWCFSIPNVLTTHPDYIEKILNSTKHTVKGYNYNSLRPWLGDGLLLSKGTKWQNRRKMLTSAFHFSILTKFVEILIAEGSEATKSINQVDESIIENLQLFTSHHALNAICETSMGTSLKNVGSFQQQIYQAVQNICRVISTRFQKPWLLSDTIFNLTSMSKTQKKCLNILHSFTEKIIAERKSYHEQTGRRYLKHFGNNAEIEDTEIIGIKKKRLALLDIMIAESQDNMLTDLDIREEIDTFMFEGHDTVSISLCFSLLLLAEHKDIQDRVRNEICEELQKNDGKFTINTLQNLSYLERCLRESLRMYPSVPSISRICTEDVQLGPYLVPEGTTIHLDIYNLHYNPKYWPNPRMFDPDRFLPENIMKRHPYSYLPFSAGPRNCIGQRYAMLELKAIIAPIVYNFYLEPLDYLKNIKFKMDVTLRASRSTRMKVIPIKRT